MDKFVLRTAEDEQDEKLLSDVKEVGWHIVGIEADDKGPAYSFSVGMKYSLHKPEILIMGLPSEVGIGLINNIGYMQREGIEFKANKNYEDVLEGFPVQFVEVDRAHYYEYLGYACWFYRGNDFKVLQMVWTDKQGFFPWDKEFDERFISFQQLLNVQKSQ